LDPVGDGHYERARRNSTGGSMRDIEIVVRLSIDEDADVQDIVSEMDYTFDHPSIKGTEIVDIVTEI
jgi:hypothetical protein